MIIAIDGPAGSGKSTLAKLIANELKIEYLDTGAMYRMVTYYFLQNNINFEIGLSEQELEECLKIKIKNNKFYLNKEDVSQVIRQDAVAQQVSKVATLKAVRNFLVAAQRKIGTNQDIIMDGRDIGTVVFPQADVKIYLIASAQKRAKRRVKQNEELNIEANYEEILANIKQRDLIDSTREESPLIKAADAIEIDTTNDKLEESFKKIIKIIKVRTNEI